MKTFLLSEILTSTGGRLIAGKKDAVFKRVCTDSRKAQEGDLFIPICGERFDGHEFIGSAFEKGAAGSLTRYEQVAKDDRILIKVENTLDALGEIAAFHRMRFNIPLIAVTGSTGKTSTKDMTACTLESAGFNTLKTVENYNNEIGLPLTLLGLDESHHAAVVEMGMRGPGQIRRLAFVAKPNIAVITNIGLSHIERLGSKENILNAKLELLEGLADNGTVILNGDDDLLLPLKRSLAYKTVLFGTDRGADIRAFDIKCYEDSLTFRVQAGNGSFNGVLNVPGKHNVSNALAAVAAGIAAGAQADKAVKGLSDYRPAQLRLNIIESDGIKVINDTYNACPDSMMAALEVLAGTSANRRIAVMGDMLEMGRWAREAHRNIGKFAALSGLDYIIGVGNHAVHICTGAKTAGKDTQIRAFEKVDDAASFLEGVLRDGDAVLLKGSRGMKMERIAKRITAGR